MNTQWQLRRVVRPPITTTPCHYSTVTPGHFDAVGRRITLACTVMVTHNPHHSPTVDDLMKCTGVVHRLYGASGVDVEFSGRKKHMFAEELTVL